MTILTIRTDNPQAEVGFYDDEKQLAYVKWTAHRELTKTVHKQIQRMLDSSSISWSDFGGIVCYRGPGSFTGLRIGFSVANALAYAQDIPVIATAGEDWINDGIAKLQKGENHKIALPRYGQPVNITKPRK